MKRVYHPKLNAWHDVPDDAVKEWLDAGWKASKPKHVNDTGVPVGEGYRPPSVQISKSEPVPAEAPSPPATPTVK